MAIEYMEESNCEALDRGILPAQCAAVKKAWFFDRGSGACAAEHLPVPGLPGSRPFMIGGRVKGDGQL
jgi:hypothetical protein